MCEYKAKIKINWWYYTISVTYNKNQEIIVTQGNSEAIKSNDEVGINAQSFHYKVDKNILSAFEKVKIQDKLNDITLFADEVTYNKNQEIIVTQGNSEAIKSNDEVIINAQSFHYKVDKNILSAFEKVKIQDKLNDITLLLMKSPIRKMII